MLLRLFVALFAISLVRVPVLMTPAAAQVTSIDSHSAEAAIINAGKRATEIARIRNVPSVGVINLSFYTSRLNDDVADVYQFRLSAQKNARVVNALRKALRRNPATRQALSQHGVSINRVVGVDIGSTGSLRVYVL
jgi:hypothetical protein